MLILSERGSVPRLFIVFEKYPYWGQKNWGNQVMAWALVSEVLLGFAKFYRQFIQGFIWIAASLIWILMTSESTESKIQPGKGGVGVGGSSRAGGDENGTRINDGEVDSGEIGYNEFGKNGQKLSKPKKTIRSDFFTLGVKLAFIKLRQAFVKAPILYHFDPNRHMRIETDVSGYAIDKVLSQLI